MTTMRCALYEDGPEDIKVTWTLFLRRVHLYYKDQIIGSFRGKELKKHAVAIALPDGNEIEIEYSAGLLLRDAEGRPLPGSLGSDQYFIMSARVGLFILSVFVLMSGIREIRG